VLIPSTPNLLRRLRRLRHAAMFKRFHSYVSTFHYTHKPAEHHFDIQFVPRCPCYVRGRGRTLYRFSFYRLPTPAPHATLYRAPHARTLHRTRALRAFHTHPPSAPRRLPHAHCAHCTHSRCCAYTPALRTHTHPAARTPHTLPRLLTAPPALAAFTAAQTAALAPGAACSDGLSRASVLCASARLYAIHDVACLHTPPGDAGTAFASVVASRAGGRLDAPHTTALRASSLPSTYSTTHRTSCDCLLTLTRTFSVSSLTYRVLRILYNIAVVIPVPLRITCTFSTTPTDAATLTLYQGRTVDTCGTLLGTVPIVCGGTGPPYHLPHLFAPRHSYTTHVRLPPPTCMPTGLKVYLTVNAAWTAFCWLVGTGVMPPAPHQPPLCTFRDGCVTACCHLTNRATATPTWRFLFHARGPLWTDGGDRTGVAYLQCSLQAYFRLSFFVTCRSPAGLYRPAPAAPPHLCYCALHLATTARHLPYE